MAFQIFCQRDPQWANHALGSGAGELGPYGCLETCFTMVAYDAYSDMHYNPASMDDTLWAKGDFQGDLLPDNALDRAWPDRFQTHTVYGFPAAEVSAAVAAPDEYAIVCIHNPAAGVTGYHFMVLGGLNLVADPWWGKWMTFATWGGPGVAVKVIFIKSLAAQRAAADAAQAAAAQAAADAQAKAAAAQAAAKAAADAAAAAAAQQAAVEQAAKDAAAKAAAIAAENQVAAEAAAKAKQDAENLTVKPLINPVERGLIEAILVTLRVIIADFRAGK